MKSLILSLLLINSPIENPWHLEALIKDSQAQAKVLGINLKVVTKPIEDRYCIRYSAYGIYSGAPKESYYYAKCLRRYTKATKNTLHHALTPPFMLGGKPTGGGYATQGYNVGKNIISVSAFLPWNYLSSFIALIHEALGHSLNAFHTVGKCWMHPDAAPAQYTATCKETILEVGKYLIKYRGKYVRS